MTAISNEEYRLEYYEYQAKDNIIVLSEFLKLYDDKNIEIKSLVKNLCNKYNDIINLINKYKEEK